MSQLSNYINGLADQVEAIDTCAALRKLQQEIMDRLNSLLEDMQGQLTDLIALSIPPTDLGTTILWIKKQIEIVKKQISAIMEEISAVTSGIARLTAAIDEKARTLGCGWAPPIIPPAIPSLPVTTPDNPAGLP